MRRQYECWLRPTGAGWCPTGELGETRRECLAAIRPGLERRGFTGLVAILVKGELPADEGPGWFAFAGGALLTAKPCRLREPV